MLILGLKFLNISQLLLSELVKKMYRGDVVGDDCYWGLKD